MVTFILNPLPTFPSSSTLYHTPSSCSQTHPSSKPTPSPLKTRQLKALLFDCDGVLAETERDGHRVSFNRTFSLKNIDVTWDEEEYGELLKVGGGKERMSAYFGKVGWPEMWGVDEREGMIRELHGLKTGLFKRMVDEGLVGLRKGVVRLAEEARGKDVLVAVCSTSNEMAVKAVVGRMGDVGRDVRVFAGDVVEKKKPSPDVYLLGAKELGVDVGDCVVIEDSRIGLLAGKAAGMKVIVTKSTYTGNEDFNEADLVYESLEDPENFVTFESLEKLVAS